MCCGKCHGGDCNSSSCHIDSCAKWNGDGVSILVQTKILAEFHVDRNVGSRASGEECCQSAVFQAAKHKWVWVLTKADKCNQWIHNKCHEEHGSDQYADQTSVSEKNVESLLGDCSEDQSHDTKWCTVNDPFYCSRDSI